MKHFRLLLLIALLAVGVRFTAHAEDSDTRPIWGIRAAFDFNLPGKWHGDGENFQMYRHGYGGTLGAVCNIYLSRDFYLEPGVSVFYDTYRYKDLVISNSQGEWVESDPLNYKIGLRVPVVVGYTIAFNDDWGLAIYTGPELSYAFAGGIRMKHPELMADTPLDLFGKNGYQRRVDCAWKVGLGFPAGAWCISVDAAFGLTDLLKSDMTYRENRLSLALTRYF